MDPSRTSKACLHVLLFSLLLLLLLPSTVLRTGVISKLKTGRDAAILYGLLLGHGGGGDYDDAADRYSVADAAELLYGRRRDNERPDQTQDTHHLALTRYPSSVEETIHPTPETLAQRPASRSRTCSPDPEELTNTTLPEVENEIIVDEINNPLPSSTALFQPGTPPMTMCEASASLQANKLTNPLPPASSFFSNFFVKGCCACFLGRCVRGGGERKPPKPPYRPVRTTPPPAPVHAHPQQPLAAQGYPQKSPLYPRCGVVYCSPPLPPPPPPPPLMLDGKDKAPSVTASPASSSCASPDVNTKADKFIQHFRARLKLEKINSYRRIQEGATETVAKEDEEFMVIGSLFEDDDDMSLPAPPPQPLLPEANY